MPGWSSYCSASATDPIRKVCYSGCRILMIDTVLYTFTHIYDERCVTGVGSVPKPCSTLFHPHTKVRMTTLSELATTMDHK